MLKSIHTLKSLKKDLRRELKKKTQNEHFLDQLYRDFEELEIRVEYVKGKILFYKDGKSYR